MENKSNSLNRIKRHQREKVLRFSIRKYSFGAASVAVAALMFLGARVVSADTVSGSSSQSTAGVVQPNDKGDSPVGIKEPTENKSEVVNNSLENKETALVENSSNTVDKSQLRTVVEELNSLLSTKLNLDDSVLSSVKERVQRAQALLDKADAVQKDINELKELLSADLATLSNAVKESSEVRESNTGTEAEKPASQSSSEVRASEENQTVSAKKDSLKVSVDQLKVAISEVPEHDTTKKVLEKANELLGVAQVVLENTTVSLNEVEDMTKRVKRMFISVKNATTRLTSGARDSRNGQRMAQGTGFRANGEINQGALTNIKYFASVDPSQNGGRDTRNNEPEFTRNKTDIQATYVKDSEGQWIVYDVFFNNDGRKMVDKSYQQHYYFQGPFNIMDLTSNGGYKSNTVKDLRFTRYRNTGGRRLSDGGKGFTKYGNTVTISNPAYQQRRIFDNDSDSFYDPNSGVTGGRNQQWEVFKNNQNDPVLNTLTKNKSGNYPGLSYYLGVDVHRASVEYAIHMHVKIKLRDNVTSEEVATYGRVYAASVTKGSTTKQSYIMGATGTRLQNDPEASLYPLKGSSHTKTVGDTLPNPENPVEAGYITLKNGGAFPAGMTWGWKNGNRPSTDTAGIFTYTATARYKDGTTSNDADGAVKFTVKPKKPAITTSVANKKGLPGQQITVNVQNGVPDGSTVNLYEGNRLIGTGKTSGGTATVTVKEALPGNPITAETVVTNANGTVTSDKSDPVTPTEAPDNQPPTLEISRKNQEVVEGENVTFTLTARDNKVVNIDFTDFANKYLTRVQQQKASYTYTKNTPEEKVIEITITTEKGDVGKENKIEFRANDGKLQANNGKPVTFTFNVTPRDNQKPIVEVGGIRLTENEPQSAQFYVYRGATFNPTVKAWDDSGNITSMSVENLPKGSQAQTYTAQTGKDGSSDAKKYTTSLSTGTVADTQTLGDHVAKFKISDGVNNATYLMKYKVVDVVVENSPKTVELNSMSGNPNNYLNTAGAQNNLGQPTVGSQADVYFPAGMNFRWDRADGSTDVQLSRVGQQTHKAIAVFPNSPGTRDGAQVYAPATAERDVVFNVVDNEKPKATLNGVQLSETANEPIFTVYRGATFNPELKVSDNSGVISKVEVKEGLPKGVTPSTFTAQTGKTEANPYATRLSSGTVLNTETLGVHESTLHVEGSNPSDSRDFKFKYRVVDIETKNVDENGIAKVPVASTLNKANSSKNIDAHNYLKVVDSQDKADRGNNYLPSGMTWTWKDRDGVNQDRGTTLDNSGKYTRTAVAIFPGTKANNMTDATSTTRDVFAPAEIKRKVILAVTPTAPTVEGKENGSVTITPPKQPDSTNQQDIDTITLTYTPTGKTSPETVTVTKSGSKWTVNGKSDDKVSVTPEGVVTISADEVADKTEVTAKVSKNIDGVLTLESPVARGTANGPLAAEVTNPAPVPEKAQITPVTVVTPNKPGSSITVDGKINGLTVDEEGKLKGTPEVNDWKPKEEERKITIPVKVKHGDEIVTKDVPVTIQRDTDGDAIPDVKDPDDDNDGIPDEEEIKNGTDPKVPTTQTPTIGITRKENGDAIVTPTKPGGGTYPRGTTVTIPGNDNTPIEVTIGDNGSGEVPNDKLPKKDVPGTGTVTEPNKAPSKPVEVTTPARKTPTVALDQDPDTGEVTVTPKKPDGTLYPENTKVEIPGKDKDHPITVTIGKDGKGKVPNSELPEGKVPGTSKITVPGKPAVEVPNVTTPSKLIPIVELDQDPKTGDVTVTPKKPDGTTYPPGTKVEIPGKDGNPITVTIGEDGKGKVPNSDLPEGKVSGPGKITEPNKPAVEVPKVETPGKVTPETPVTEKPGKIEITRQPNGNAIVTPKKPDGTTYPSGSKVEIPGENGTPITVTIGDNGSGEVPNDNLPKEAVPGTGTVTEPNKKPSQPVDVTTPARKTPTVDVEQDPKTGDVTVTPKKPDGSTYPPGTKVEIPGKDGNTITVTIGEDGKGKVPNSELPEGKVPGTGKITEPGKPAVEVLVTTPAKVRPNTPTNAQVDNGNNRGKTEKVSEIKKDTKRLANTGTTETNTGLAGLGLGILGGLLAAARRRKNDKN